MIDAVLAHAIAIIIACPLVNTMINCDMRPRDVIVTLPLISVREGIELRETCHVAP